jgi:hypothetical protein
LISQVILKRLAADRVEARVVWVSGHYTVLLTRPPVQRDSEVSGYEQMVERIRQMWEEGMSDDLEIAAKLSVEGFRSARSAGVSSKSVLKIRLQNGWHSTSHQSRKSRQAASGDQTVKTGESHQRQLVDGSSPTFDASATDRLKVGKLAPRIDAQSLRMKAGLVAARRAEDQNVLGSPQKLPVEQRRELPLDISLQSESSISHKRSRYCSYAQPSLAATAPS